MDELLVWKQQQFHIPVGPITTSLLQKDLPVVTGKVLASSTITYDKALEMDFNGEKLWLIASAV